MQDAFLASVLRQALLGSRDPDMVFIYCRAISSDQLLSATSKLGCNAFWRLAVELNHAIKINGLTFCRWTSEAYMRSCYES